MRTPTSLWSILFSLFVCRVFASDPNPLIVQTSSGQVTGFINNTAPHVRQFLSIPFASPPLGPLRFQPPLPKRRGPPIQATQLPSNCMQVKPPPGGPAGAPAGRGFTIVGNISEDCLYLNVYTPVKKSDARLPVLIWLYGGGFVNGGTDVPYQIPDRWVERTKSHIVVTFK